MHNGMDSFKKMPQAGEVYVAEWKDEMNNIIATQLPRVKPSGVSLQVDQSPGVISNQIKRPEESASGTYYIVASANSAMACLPGKGKFG